MVAIRRINIVIMKIAVAPELNYSLPKAIWHQQMTGFCSIRANNVYKTI